MVRSHVIEIAEETTEEHALRSRKRAAVEFLRGSVSGRVREVYEKHVATDFKHHNPHFKGDSASLRAAMERSATEHPDKELEVLRVLAEGDVVAVHSCVRLHWGDPGFGLVHIFRFEGDRIIELWDIAQVIPLNSPNENGMF